MIVPAAFFAPMPEHATCRGSMEAGASVVPAGSTHPSSIRSIAAIVRTDGEVVGWVYLLDDARGRSEAVQANGLMSGSDLRALGVRWTGAQHSSLAPLDAALPADLRPIRCRR